MHIAPADRKLLASLAALVALSFGFEVAQAQFTAPTCVPPNCSPTVIQNIDITTGTAQSASINITGDAKLGATFQAGANAPVLSSASSNLYYGNVGATSSAGALMLLQNGLVDRLRVTLTGQMQLPLGSAAAPSYSFIGDTNNGLYSSAADSMTFVTNGVARETINNSGVTVASGQLTVPVGSAAAPSITFAGDTNTGIYHSAADTIVFVTNGTAAETISPTGAVTFPGSVTVNGTFTASGGYTGDGSQLTNINASNITTGTLSDARLSSNVALYNANGTFTGANTFSNAGNSFTGSGAGLTSLNASNLASGTVAAARLPANVAYTDATQTFTGANTFSNAANSFTGSGAGLTALNATQLTSGTLPSARLSGTYSGALTFSGNDTLSGMTTFGSGARVLAAGQNLLYGLISNTSTGGDFLLMQKGAGVNEFYVDINGNVWAAGTYTGNGSGLTNLNAANLVGSVPPGSLPATTAYTDASQSFTGVNDFSNPSNTFTGSSGTFGSTLTVAGQNVCQQNGVNCPATLGGSGTANYLTKFTGSGNTVGNSTIQDNGTNIGIGGAPSGWSVEVYGNIHGKAFSGNVADQTAIYGGTTDNSSFGQSGVWGQANGTQYGYGVSGMYTGTNASGYGVYGLSQASGGVGVYGYSTGASGNAGYFYAANGGTALTANAGASPFTAIHAMGHVLVDNNLTVNGLTTLGDQTSDVVLVTGMMTFTGGAGTKLTLPSGSSPPAGVFGAMYLNTTDNMIYCYTATGWNACGKDTPAESDTIDTVLARGNTTTRTMTTGAQTINASGAQGLVVNGAFGWNGITSTGGYAGIQGSGTAYGGNFSSTGAYGVYAANTHSGGSPGYGVYADASGAANAVGLRVVGNSTNNALEVAGGNSTFSGNGTFSGQMAVNGASINSTYGLSTQGSTYGTYSVSTGGGYGVYGSGQVGVGGVGGQYGIYGNGTLYGVYGYSAGQYGVFGNCSGTNCYGVEGVASGSGGTGVVAMQSSGSYALQAIGTSYFSGDIQANNNSWGTGYGWYGCGLGGYCTCANGTFVGQVYRDPADNWWGAMQVYCYKP